MEGVTIYGKMLELGRNLVCFWVMILSCWLMRLNNCVCVCGEKEGAGDQVQIFYHIMATPSTCNQSLSYSADCYKWPAFDLILLSDLLSSL